MLAALLIAFGVVFVADSQLKEAKANQDAWAGMVENLRENGLEHDQIPIVIQFNKRDLPGVLSDEEIFGQRPKRKTRLKKLAQPFIEYGFMRRALAGALTAIMTGTAYEQSAEVASILGPFPGYRDSRCAGVAQLVHEPSAQPAACRLEAHDAARCARLSREPATGRAAFAAERALVAPRHRTSADARCEVHRPLRPRTRDAVGERGTEAICS